jgi:hypothetical protein
MKRRVGPWVFGICAAAVLYAFHIRRWTWPYYAISLGTVIALIAVGFLVLRFRGRD